MHSLLLFLGVLGWTSGAARAGDTLCSLPPVSYANAKEDYPDSAFALEQLESQGVATWYSDRNDDPTQTATDLVAKCPESSRLSVVVYGLPNKDCEAGYSNGDGTVATGADYKVFIKTLTDIIGERKVLYVLEPDAVGLLADQGCAVESGYESNLTTAISLLSHNPNAEIYLDVGFWTLEKSDTADIVARIVKKLVKKGKGRVKGITLNTSNYRSTDLMAELCTNFQTAMDSTDIGCVVDTSRNSQEFLNSSSSEWCNVRQAGIGVPPTNTTEYDNIDYLLYVKPPGDSDGTCDDQSADAMRGPEAGKFFNDHFIKLWNQGYFVNTKEMATIYDPNEETSGCASQWPTSTGTWVVTTATTVLLLMNQW